MKGRGLIFNFISNGREFFNEEKDYYYKFVYLAEIKIRVFANNT